jgi:acetyltransferase
VLADPGADSVSVNLATTGKAGSLAAAETLGRVAAETEKPIVVFSSAPASVVGGALAHFAEVGIPVMPSPSRAARAIAMLARYREARAQLGAAESSSHSSQPAAWSAELQRLAAQGALSETQSKAILAEAGVSVSKDVVVQGVDGSVFERLKAPLVVKIVSKDIPHKTEIGGVKVGIKTRPELEVAIAEVLANAKARAPEAKIDGVLVSEMVRGGFELIAGVVNDEVFGPVVVVGAGGIYTEILRDTSCRIAPFGETTAREMLDELNCRRILDGVRGGPALDVDAVATSLAALSRFAWAARDIVQEVDINPVFVLPQGAIAVDALIVPRNPSSTASH